MVIGEVYYEDENKNKIDDKDVENITPSKKKSKVIKYKFVKMDDTKFEEKHIDISDLSSVNEVIDKLDLNENIYKIFLDGTRNIDIDTLIESIKISNKNVCSVVDNTRIAQDFKSISMQNNLKGIFTKKILEYIKENPEKEEIANKAIEFVYRSK